MTSEVNKTYYEFLAEGKLCLLVKPGTSIPKLDSKVCVILMLLIQNATLAFRVVGQSGCDLLCTRYL